MNLIPSDFRAGENSEWRWGQAVLEQIRKTSFEAEFVQGVNNLTIYAMEPGVVLQQIGIYDCEVRMPEAYLGQEESFFEE